MIVGGLEYLCHVVSTFQHQGQDHSVIAYFGEHERRWLYEVLYDLDVDLGKVWPDGQPQPGID